MKAFNDIRAEARRKRDAAIKKARDEYERTLADIARLEQDILGRDFSDHRTLSSMMNAVIPTDRPFTTLDILSAVEAMDSGRVWRKRTVDHHIARLRDKGILRRIRKSNGTERALYAHKDCKTEPRPFEDMRLPEVIADVLGDRSMTQTEIAVAMLEQGYDTTMGKKALRDAVGVMLRDGEQFFSGEGGKWALSPPLN